MVRDARDSPERRASLVESVEVATSWCRQWEVCPCCVHQCWPSLLQHCETVVSEWGGGLRRLWTRLAGVVCCQ